MEFAASLHVVQQREGQLASAFSELAGDMTRATPPSFDFYPDDFVAGTVHMTACELGMYIRYLCFQWGHGYLPEDDETLKRIAGISGDEFNKHWPIVREKFTSNGSGDLVNDRLQEVRAKALTLREARQKAGRKGGSSKATNLLEAKDVAKSSRRKKEVGRRKKEVIEENGVPASRFQRPTVEEIATFAAEAGLEADAEAIWDFYESKGWQVGRSQMKDWKAAVRRAVRDGWGKLKSGEAF